MLFRKLSLFCILFGLISMAACNQAASPDTDTSDESAEAQNEEEMGESNDAEEAQEDDTHDVVHWGYEGEGGPQHWGEIDPAYELCGTGMAQSPIDISAAAPEDLVDIAFNYSNTAVNIINNGHTVQVNYDQGSSIEVNGKVYNLLQFHFHSPSEHELDGNLTTAEMHLVHQSDDGAYAVVGVMITEGDENPAFADIWANMPDEESDVETIEGLAINALSLLPETRTYYHYAGSFTTPPCTEGVNWMVLTTPIAMSSEQINAFHDLFGDNNRPVQPIHDRDLVEDTSTN